VHINYFPAEFDELYKPTLQIIGDIGNTMRQLTERNIESHHYDFSNIYKIRQKIQISTQNT
jgi:thiamine pyrophosphate-dependent acetolactate synthase large subunit-like protein